MKREVRGVLFFGTILLILLSFFAASEFSDVRVYEADSVILDSVSDSVKESGRSVGGRYVCDVNYLNTFPVLDLDIHKCGLNSGGCCFGDVDGNGVVNAGDRGMILANFGGSSEEALCRYDLDGNGVINPGDRGFVAANIGICAALPDYQNGSGCLGGDCPDTRFPEPCSEVSVPDVEVTYVPSAGFTAMVNPINITLNEELVVNFSVLNHDPSLTYEWNFGSCVNEGGWDEGSLTSYRFTKVGEQIVNVVARNSCGNSATRSVNFTVRSIFPLFPNFNVYRMVGEGRNGCFGTWEVVSHPPSHVFAALENIKFGGTFSTGAISNMTWQFRHIGSGDALFLNGQEVIQSFALGGNYSANLTIERASPPARFSLSRNFIVA